VQAERKKKANTSFLDCLIDSFSGVVWNVLECAKASRSLEVTCQNQPFQKIFSFQLALNANYSFEFSFRLREGPQPIPTHSLSTVLAFCFQPKQKNTSGVLCCRGNGKCKINPFCFKLIARDVPRLAPTDNQNGCKGVLSVHQ